MCIGATDVALSAARRSIASQLRHAFDDSVFGGSVMPPAVRQVARACSARFSVAETAPDDLQDLFILAVMADNDTLAHATTARRVALATNTTERAAVFQDAIEQYLRAEPARIVEAEAMAARIDALGTTVQIARLDAHAQLLRYGMSKFNEPYMRREAERIIELGQEVPVSPIQYHFLPIIEAYMALAQIAYVEAPDSVLAIVMRAKKDLGRFPPASEWPRGMSYSLIELTPFKTATPVTVRNVLLPFNADRYTGASLPPVEASYWFPAPPRTWPPGGSAASLVVYGGFLAGDCVRSEWSLLIFTMRKECLALRTLVPSWVQQYGSRLSVTLVAQTQGNAVRSLAVPPKVEADSIAWYIRQHLALPVTVGVVMDSVHLLPPIDGRHIHKDPTFYGRKFKYGVTLLYGTGGKLLYVGVPQLDEPILRKLLTRELRENAQASTPRSDDSRVSGASIPTSAGNTP
jgi:hypothetical protein